MFARTAEIRLKPNTRAEFLELVNTELLPLITRQPGCIDSVGLFSDTDLHAGLAITFWKSRQEAERFYNSDEFRGLQQRIQPYLSQDVKVSTYNVDASTYHRVSAGRAA